MSELIRRECVIKAIYNNKRCCECSCTSILRDIRTIPIVDAVEVVHGKWIESEIESEKWCCSICGGAAWYYDYEGDIVKSRYCPNCGAKMDGGK